MQADASVTEPCIPRAAIPSKGFELALASQAELQAIYRLRHEVYACEIGQHARNPTSILTDALDGTNIYLVVRFGDELAGFISLTPPEAGKYSIEKYFERAGLPFAVDDGLYGVRLLTVRRDFRGTKVAALLMYAAFRLIEAIGSRSDRAL